MTNLMKMTILHLRGTWTFLKTDGPATDLSSEQKNPEYINLAEVPIPASNNAIFILEMRAGAD